MNRDKIIALAVALITAIVIAIQLIKPEAGLSGAVNIGLGILATMFKIAPESKNDGN